MPIAGKYTFDCPISKAIILNCFRFYKKGVYTI